MDTREIADPHGDTLTPYAPGAPEKSNMRGSVPRGSALKFVVLLGIVNLFADKTHEGARGIKRTFRLVEGGPLPTSYGEDSYKRIFG